MFQIKSSDGLPLTLCVSCVQRLNRRHTLQMALLKHTNPRVMARTRVQSDTDRRECNQQIQFSPAAVQSI